MEQKQIVIVGGGFAGISCALALAKSNLPHTKICLISEKSHFEYHAALYRLVTGSSPLEVCVPLRDIFAGKNIEVIEDSVVLIDKTSQKIKGMSGSSYHYDYLALALGSETNYFGIPGLKEFSFGMKSITEALRLKQHITEMLLTCKIDFENKVEQICDANFVVIGAGATGVEMAGQLIVYARELAVAHGVDPSLVSVELIEGAPKILPALPPEFTDRIEHHLRGLGVNIFLNRSIEREECEQVFLKDMQIKARTVIWTAGVKASHSYETFGFAIDKRGRVEVDEHLMAKGEKHIFIAGDGAATKYSGWAQTAMYDGRYIALIVAAHCQGQTLTVPYAPKAAINAIPAGPEWAGVLWGPFRFYGKLGWWLRRLLDFQIFLAILPFNR
jgi:NADH dehydrogenase